MILAVTWSPAATATLLKLSDWRMAAEADRAVQRLATTGRGDLRRMGASRTEYSLYVGGCCVRLSLDREAQRITVRYVFALR